jgi:hypothetical protein
MLVGIVFLIGDVRPERAAAFFERECGQDMPEFQSMPTREAWPPRRIL